MGRRWTPPREVRAAVWEACGGECHYCGCELQPFGNFQVDHVVPRSRGGGHELANLVGACARCNRRKGARLDFNGPSAEEPKARGDASEWSAGSDAETRTLREWRARRALAMADLVSRSGVTKTTIIAIEHGRVTAIKRRTMRRLSEALGVEPGDVAEFRRALSGPAPAHDD